MRERSHARLESLLIAFHDEVPSELFGVVVAKLYHLAELPFGVDVHQRERHLSGGKSLLCQTHHDTTVLTDTIKHDRILKFGSHLTYDVDALCFKFLQMRKIVFHNKYKYKMMY